MNNTGWFGGMEQRHQQEQRHLPRGPYSAQQGQQPPYGPYSANSWTTPGRSVPFPPPDSAAANLPPAPHQSVAPSRQPVFNPEAENHQDGLPSYDDAVTDVKDSNH